MSGMYYHDTFSNTATLLAQGIDILTLEDKNKSVFRESIIKSANEGFHISIRDPSFKAFQFTPRQSFLQPRGL